MVFINFPQELAGGTIGTRQLPGPTRNSQELRELVLSCKPNEQLLKINDFVTVSDGREMLFGWHRSTNLGVVV